MTKQSIKAILFVVILLAITATGCHKKSPLPDNHKIMAQYDAAVKKHGAARRKLDRRADSLRKAPSLTRNDSAMRLIALGEVYNKISLDSSLRTFSLLTELATKWDDDSLRIAATLWRCGTLMWAGQSAEAALIFSKIDPDSLPAEQVIQYNAIGQLIGFLSFDRARGFATSKYFKDMCLKHTAQLLKHYPDSTNSNRLSMAAFHYLNGAEREMVPYLMAIIQDSSDKTMTSIAAFWLGIYYTRNEGEQSLRGGYYLMQAAIEELNSGSSTGLAMGPLGQWFYDVGQRRLGMQAWRISVENSNRSGVHNQWIENQALAATTFKVIDKYTRNHIIVMWILGGLLIILAIASVAIWRLRRREYHARKHLQRRLEEFTQSKQMFVGEFLKLFSLFMEGIEEHSRLLQRRIAAGKTTEIIESLRSGRLLHEQGKILFSGFDCAFLNVFPTFVDDLNALLLPDKRIELQDPHVLTPELRIMALQRLGIDDSQRIARMLGFSVNTIYAYRNKIRARVIDKDFFHENFMNIGRPGY